MREMRSYLGPAAATAAMVLAVVMAAAPARGLTIQLDYTYDGGFFASNPSAVSAMQAAAGAFEIFTDDLLAIEPGGVNTWNAFFTRPDTGSTMELANPTVAADTLRVYVGGRALGGTTLAHGGPGGFSAAGTQTWLDTVVSRGESGALEDPITDFGPWGGSISFDTSDRDWHFDHTVSPGFGDADFYAVAVHELAHVLGFGTSSSFEALVDSTADRFLGEASEDVYGQQVPLAGGYGHWEAGTASTVGDDEQVQEASMTPTIALGSRKYFTTLDYAGLADVGWQMPPGDTDMDGDVDFDDAWTVLSHYRDGRTDHTHFHGDFDGDGDVDGDDAAVLLNLYGSGAPAAGDAPVWLAQMAEVPEPTVFVLLMVGLLVVMARRRRPVAS
ncbi:MAG: matrixin family metalloprotease [Phycisphaerae bacterium]